MDITQTELLDDLLHTHPVDRWKNGSPQVTEDLLAVESPIAIEYNGISYAVMLASPANLADFALGFSLTEGIISHTSEMYDCEVVPHANGVVVQVEIATKRVVEMKDRRRNLTGRTGCGLCGVETIDQAVRHPTPVLHRQGIAETLLMRGMELMHGLQPLHQACGATHAAAWMNLTGEIVCVREDVGRHNALDKLIGRLALSNCDFSQGIVLITSRASYEMVQKTATMGIGLLAAISAPTSLAVQLAQETGVTLAGYVRGQSFVLYAHPERIQTA